MLASAASSARAVGRQTWRRMREASCPVVVNLGALPAWPRRARCGGPDSPGAAAENVEAATWRWVDSWVIGMGLCPFAAPVRNRRCNAGEGEEPALRCAVTHAAQTDELLSAVRAELALLAPGITSQRPPESTLLVVSPAGDSKFLEEYRDFVHASWDVQQAIVEAGLETSVQVVLFHPKAVHSLYGEQQANADGDNDASGGEAATCFSIRSPFPTFHFLRERDIMAAVTSGYPQPEEIPGRNARKLAALGSARLRAQWQALVAHP